MYLRTVPMLYKVLLTLLILCGLPFSTAHAQDHIISRAYWEDTSGQASAAQANVQTFTAYQDVLSKGYTNSAIWIRLEIKPDVHTAADGKLILRIRPIYLDELTLYDPLDTSDIPRMTGDRTNYTEEEYESLTHTFVIPEGDKPRFLLLRLKTTSTTLVHIEALSADDMLHSEIHMMLSYYFVLSLIAVFLILVFINWLNYKDSLYALFVVRHAIYFVYSASFFGFHRLLLGDLIEARILDIGYNWLVIGATGFSIWFETRLLREYSPPNWAKKILNGLLAWSAIAALILLFGEARLALKINMMLNGIGIIVLLVTAFIFIDDGKAHKSRVSSLLKKKVLVSYYLTLTAFIWLSVMANLGGVGGNAFSTYGLVFYALYSGVVMTVLMQLRANQLRNTNIQFAQDLLLSEQQVELEILRREEQSQLLTMLMHEIKNPLTVIDLAQHADNDQEAKNYIRRNVSIIKNILDRCLNADRISIGKLNVKKQDVDVHELLRTLIAQQAAGSQEIMLHTPSNAVNIHTDYQCLRIILSNLIDNALRYGVQLQAIEVFVSNKNNATGNKGLSIIVANKPGIASWPEPEKVFQKYYRSTGAKSISGTGLGLFLVASISKIIGATCDYIPDETSVRFELWLPT